jgi:hypothetical protein
MGRGAYRWGDRARNNEDEADLEFTDNVNGVLLNQLTDLEAVRSARTADRRLLAVAGLDALSHGAPADLVVWPAELKSAWAA